MCVCVCNNTGVAAGPTLCMGAPAAGPLQARCSGKLASVSGLMLLLRTRLTRRFHVVHVLSACTLVEWSCMVVALHRQKLHGWAGVCTLHSGWTVFCGSSMVMRCSSIIAVDNIRPPGHCVAGAPDPCSVHRHAGYVQGSSCVVVIECCLTMWCSLSYLVIDCQCGAHQFDVHHCGQGAARVQACSHRYM